MPIISIVPHTWNIAAIDSGSFRNEARKTVEDHMKRVQEDVAHYPAPVPTYVRTNTLFRSWHRVTRDSGDAIEVEVYNDAQDKYARLYSRFVHGDSQGMGQRAYHAQQGWRNLYQTHKAREPQLIQKAENMVIRALRKIFGETYVG